VFGAHDPIVGDEKEHGWDRQKRHESQAHEALDRGGAALEPWHRAHGESG
jgi:hypothetical protein